MLLNILLSEAELECRDVSAKSILSNFSELEINI